MGDTDKSGSQPNWGAAPHRMLRHVQEGMMANRLTMEELILSGHVSESDSNRMMLDDPEFGEWFMQRANARQGNPRKPSISERATASVRDMPAKEIAEHKGPSRIVTDDSVGDALRYLATSAADLGAARMNMELSAARLKRREAIEFFASDEKTVEAKKFSIRLSDAWMEAETEHAVAVGEFEKLKALRDAAMARIDAWRSETASLRANMR